MWQSLKRPPGCAITNCPIPQMVTLAGFNCISILVLSVTFDCFSYCCCCCWSQELVSIPVLEHCILTNPFSCSFMPSSGLSVTFVYVNSSPLSPASCLQNCMDIDIIFRHIFELPMKCKIIIWQGLWCLAAISSDKYYRHKKVQDSPAAV